MTNMPSTKKSKFNANLTILLSAEGPFQIHYWHFAPGPNKDSSLKPINEVLLKI